MPRTGYEGSVKGRQATPSLTWRKRFSKSLSSEARKVPHPKPPKDCSPPDSSSCCQVRLPCRQTARIYFPKNCQTDISKFSHCILMDTRRFIIWQQSRVLLDTHQWPIRESRTAPANGIQFRAKSDNIHTVPHPAVLNFMTASHQDGSDA